MKEGRGTQVRPIRGRERDTGESRTQGGSQGVKQEEEVKYKVKQEVETRQGETPTLLDMT